MNELNTRLLEYLPDPNTVKGGIGSVVETLQDEAPLLVGEVLKWNFAKSAGICLLLVFVFIFILFLARLIWAGTIGPIEIENKKTYPDVFGWYILRYLVIILSIIPLAVMLSYCQWLQIWIAPRLFLLEYVSNLMK